MITIKKDLDVSPQRMIFNSALRKDVKGMDKDMLGQFIRFTAHGLDKATKCENKFEGRGDERNQILEKALDEWIHRGYQMGPDKLWARKMLENFKCWGLGEAKLIQPVIENNVSVSHEIFSVIEQRSSVRFWKKKKVERKKVEKILKAATYAPSSCNRMTWRFFVVKNDMEKVVIGNSTNLSLLEKAPVRIYLGIDERLYPEIYAPAIDAGIALQNIVLASHALGLGSCMMYHCESVDQIKLKKEFNIPDYYRIYCAVLLGYPDEIPTSPARVSFEEVSTFIENKAKGNKGTDYFRK